MDHDKPQVRQGDVYWFDFGRAVDSGPAGLRPCVVVQNDTFNRSKLKTTVVCGITSNLLRAKSPANVRLEPGEGGLEMESVVNVSQISTIDKQHLAEPIGTLSQKRIDEIQAGIQRMLERT